MVDNVNRVGVDCGERRFELLETLIRVICVAALWSSLQSHLHRT